MNNHSTPVHGKRPEKRDLSTSSIDLEVESKKNKISDSDIMQNSQIINHIQLSEADLECISQKMHALFKADLETMVRSVVQAFIPQVITGINASLNDKIESLTQENTHLKNQVAELLFQADRAEQYSRRNCLRITGIPEASDEDTDTIVVTMAKDLGAELSIDEIDRSHRVGPPKHSGPKARDIIVKFVSYRARQKLYSVRTRAKDSDCYKGKFINESLTKLRSELFFDARKLVLDKLVEGAWTHDGNILVRDRKRVIHRVESAEHICKLRSDANRSYASVTKGSK